MPPIPNPTEEDLAPETLVPRLGEYLLEKGLITSRELQQALDYQKKKAANGQPRLLGRALMELGYIDRETLDKVIITQIFSLHTALQEANRHLEQRVQLRTQDLEKRLAQIHATAEIAQAGISACNLEELLKRTVKLIIERLHFDHAAIFLIDEAGQFAVLHAASGPIGQLQNLGEYRLPIGSQSMIGWVAEHKQVRLTADMNKDTFFMKGELFPAARSEVGIPIELSNSLLGILHIQHSRVEAFDADATATLQTIANLIASLIQNHRLLESTQQNLRVMEKRLVALETLDLVNKTISAETNLDKLFHLVHEQILKIMGDANFSIVLYDSENNTIEIPYAYENGKNLSVPPHPMTQGLESLLIQNKKPLLLVEDTERKAAELGANVTVSPAKSWLGAPLLVGGDVLGAIIVQDQEHEHRFDEDDQRLLTNLATQVAITVRNVFQLENARRQAERERIAAEISAKLWASTDIHTILHTAIQELSRKLEASEGTILLQSPTEPEPSAMPANNGNKEAIS